MITELIALAGIASAINDRSKGGRKSSKRNSYSSYNNSKRRSYNSRYNNDDNSYSSSRRSNRSYDSGYNDALAWQHDHSDLGV